MANFPQWLKAKVASAEADYLVREGHVLRAEVGSIATVEKGTRRVGTSADGAHEIVLLFPDQSTVHSTSFVSADELRKSLHGRAEIASDNELLYFDTKCGAFSGSCRMSKVLDAGNINVIAPERSATTFVDRSSSPLRALLEGVLKREDYETLGKGLESARKRSRAVGSASATRRSDGVGGGAVRAGAKSASPARCISAAPEDGQKSRSQILEAPAQEQPGAPISSAHRGICPKNSG